MNIDNAVTVNVIRGSVVGLGYFSYVLSLFVPSSATKYLKTIFYQLFMLSLTFFVCKWIHNHFFMWSPWSSQIIFARRNCSAWQRNGVWFWWCFAFCIYLLLASISLTWASTPDGNLGFSRFYQCSPWRGFFSSGSMDFRCGGAPRMDPLCASVLVLSGRF